MKNNNTGTVPQNFATVEFCKKPNRLSASLVTGAGLLISTLAWGGAFPPELQLSDLLPANGGDGTIGTIFSGIAANDRSGSAVAAGDINGDGVADVIIGAHKASPGGDTSAGEAYVVFGNPLGMPAEFDLASLSTGDGTTGFVLQGINPGDEAGMSLNDGIDINGDGFDDLIIGSNFADAEATLDSGESYVIYGSNTGFPAVIDLSTLASGDGTVGFVIKGISIGDFAGSIGRGGDFNNDMIDDIIIGAKNANPANRNNAGESYVVFGNSSGFGSQFLLSSLRPANGGDGSAGFILTGKNPFDESGTAVDSAGDVNGDGIDDILISAPEADGAGSPFVGEVYVVYGRSTSFPAVFNLATLSSANGGNGFVMYGGSPSVFAGRAISGAGDINNDGFDDVIVGATGGTGRAFVVFGRNNFSATFSLTSLQSANGGDGSEGFVAEGVAVGDSTGREVSALGDVNNDGLADIAIGAFQASPGGISIAGSTYVLFGSTSGFPADVALSGLLAANGGDGSTGFAIHGIDAQDSSGISVSQAGDINGDSIDDMVIGASGANGAAGESYAVYGQQVAIVDADGDGIADIDDNCPAVANPDQLDDDIDGIGNFCDNCAAVANADQLDDDADDIGNVCDNCAAVANADQLDDDADDIGNVCDNCAAVANADQLDDDADDIGNVCDNCAAVANADQLDDDADDIGNVCDNCAAVANADQLDDDADDIGNVCDNCAAVANTDQLDDDADDIGNVCDNCIAVANIGQQDADSDGHGNICDADFDNNCFTTFPDLAIMQTGFFTVDPLLDLNSSGGPTNFGDLAIMQGLFFLPPGPSAPGALCN